MCFCCAELSEEKKVQLLEKLTGGDVGECPICMDGAQDPLISLCCHGPFCRDCITASLQHQVCSQTMVKSVQMAMRKMKLLVRRDILELADACNVGGTC